MTWDDDRLLTDLFNAYRDARKHKRTSRSQLSFEMNLEHNLILLYEKLKDRTYRPSPCVCFVSNYPVKREVFASQFKDRVVHHLLYNYLKPVFEPKMIYDSYSCRTGKGTLFGIERLGHHIRSVSANYTKSAYVLKLDVKGYFMSISKHRLFDIVSAQFKEDTPLNGFVRFLLEVIIYNDPRSGCFFKSRKSEWEGLPASKSLFNNPEAIGLPIGDLTSQMFSNIYLNELDQYVKRTLNCMHYGRYVDDFYIVDNDANRLKALVPQIRSFLRDSLQLTLHPQKIVLQHVTKGIPFLGAYLMPYRRLPSRRSIGAFKSAVRKIDEDLTPSNQREMIPVLNSYLGYFSHFCHYKLVNETLLRTKHVKYLLFNPGLTIAKENICYKNIVESRNYV